MGPKFLFEIDDKVTIKVSQLEGVVIGRAEYKRSNPSFLITYADRNGCLIEDWISEEQLEAADAVIGL